MSALSTSNPPTSDPWKWVFYIGGAGNVLNAAWMLASPVSWYENLPAGIPDFGPMNEHFIRDLGAVFLMMGVGFIWGGFSKSVRIPVLALVTFWYAAHALIHVYDTARGLVPPSHWAMDFPAIYAPTIFLIVVLVMLTRSSRD